MKKDPEKPSKKSRREELEIRLTALVLDETSPFEEAELRRQLSEDAELLKFYNDLKESIELIREISDDLGKKKSTPSTAEKLSKSRRKSLLQQFRNPAVEKKETPQKKVKPRKTFWLMPINAAAGFIGLIGISWVLSLILQSEFKQSAKALRVTSEMVAEKKEDLMKRLSGSSASMSDSTTGEIGLEKYSRPISKIKRTNSRSPQKKEPPNKPEASPGASWNFVNQELEELTKEIREREVELSSREEKSLAREKNQPGSPKSQKKEVDFLVSPVQLLMENRKSNLGDLASTQLELTRRLAEGESRRKDLEMNTRNRTSSLSDVSLRRTQFGLESEVSELKWISSLERSDEVAKPTLPAGTRSLRKNAATKAKAGSSVLVEYRPQEESIGFSDESATTGFVPSSGLTKDNLGFDSYSFRGEQSGPQDVTSPFEKKPTRQRSSGSLSLEGIDKFSENSGFPSQNQAVNESLAVMDSNMDGIANSISISNGNTPYFEQQGLGIDFQHGMDDSSKDGLAMLSGGFFDADLNRRRGTTDLRGVERGTYGEDLDLSGAYGGGGGLGGARWGSVKPNASRSLGRIARDNKSDVKGLEIDEIADMERNLPATTLDEFEVLAIQDDLSREPLVEEALGIPAIDHAFKIINDSPQNAAINLWMETATPEPALAQKHPPSLPGILAGPISAAQPSDGNRTLSLISAPTTESRPVINHHLAETLVLGAVVTDTLSDINGEMPDLFERFSEEELVRQFTPEQATESWGRDSKGMTSTETGQFGELEDTVKLLSGWSDKQTHQTWNIPTEPEETDTSLFAGVQLEDEALSVDFDAKEISDSVSSFGRGFQHQRTLLSSQASTSSKDSRFRKLKLKNTTTATPNVSASSSIQAGAPVAATKPVAPPPPAPKPPESTVEFLTETQANSDPFSTFSLNVSDVSFNLAAASLETDQVPDPTSVRVEEFVNAFHYYDPLPASGLDTVIKTERARFPFAHNRDVLRVSVQTSAQGRPTDKSLNLVLLLDNSGSMERPDRREIVQAALRILAEKLSTSDKISVVAFSRTARLWVDGLSGGQPDELLNSISRLLPQGGTNLEEALNQAYHTATKFHSNQYSSRVILLTDGAANLGNIDPEALTRLVETQRRNGIALDCFGIGWQGFNDTLLEELSRNGDGRYGFLNSLEEVNAEFAEKLAGAFRPAASDVKVQIEFNPQRVKSHRLIGYANHRLKKEQFRDNTVDAAELGSNESGNALYILETELNGSGPIATMQLRYRIPGTGQYVESSRTIPFEAEVPALRDAPESLRLATVAGVFGEWLAGNPFTEGITLRSLADLLRGVSEAFPYETRPQQLEWMIQKTSGLTGK